MKEEWCSLRDTCSVSNYFLIFLSIFCFSWCLSEFTFLTKMTGLRTKVISSAKKFNIIFLCCCWLNLVLILRRISKYDPRARQKAKVNMFPKVLKLSEGSSSISLYTHNVKWIKIWCHALLQSLFSLQFTQFVKIKMTLVLQKMWDLSYINHFSLFRKQTMNFHKFRA